MTVTAIRPVGRAQALEQLRLDPSLATISLSALAKRWGVSRSTVRNWLKVAPEPPRSPLTIAMEAAPAAAPAAPLPPAPLPSTPLAYAPTMLAAAAPAPVATSDGGLTNLSAYAAAAALASVAAYFSVTGMARIFPGANEAIIAIVLSPAKSGPSAVLACDGS